MDYSDILLNINSNSNSSEHVLDEDYLKIPLAVSAWEAWIQRSHEETKKLRDDLWSKMKDKVIAILQYMSTMQLNLPLFLDVISWGHEECRLDPTINYARTQLLFSNELPDILERWWKPPKARANSARPRGANAVFEELAIHCLAEKVDEEMENSPPQFLRSKHNKLSVDELQSICFEDVISQMKSNTPTVLSLFQKIVETKEMRSARRCPDRTIMTVLTMLAYTRKNSNNRIPKLFAVYFKFHGLSAKAFDTLHSLGLVMSMKWTTDCVADLAASSKKQLHSLRDNCFWFMSHDNLNIAFQVYSQRIDNQTHFDSGTAATIYVKPDEEPIPLNLPKMLQETRIEGLKNPLTVKDLMLLDRDASKQLRPFLISLILKTLLNTDEFDLKTYKYRDNNLLNGPELINPVPYGPDYTISQFLLGTVKMEEASYEGNNLLISEWLHQLGLYSTEHKKQTGLERIIFFAGDQLTVEHLRGLFRMRVGDFNSYDRYDWLIPVFGWLHLLMALANSLHKQYLGSSGGHGLHHAIVLLKRKGLLRALTKGPFYHDIKELLMHVLEAHLQLCWQLVSKEEDLSKLREKNPDELNALAETVFKDFASHSIVTAVTSDAPCDEVKLQTSMMIRDLLHYSLLENAVKHGDVGIMENLLPHLLFRFHGGSNPKYALEVMELLQSLRREWPPELSQIVRRHCWLVNFEGKSNTFLPVDMAQEHNVCDIKRTYRPNGPNSDWDYLKKISPAIPIIKAIAAHVEEESGVLSRGKKHGNPDRSKDVELLQRAYRDSNLHLEDKTRVIRKSEFTKDYYIEGIKEIQKGKFMAKWFKGRNFKRETTELWEEKTREEDDVTEDETEIDNEDEQEPF